MKVFKVLVSVLVMTMMAACGGGSGGGAKDTSNKALAENQTCDLYNDLDRLWKVLQSDGEKFISEAPKSIEKCNAYALNPPNETCPVRVDGQTVDLHPVDIIQACFNMSLEYRGRN